MEFWSKFKLLHTQRTWSPVAANYTLHGYTLEKVDAVNYLGITFTENLKWDLHITNEKTMAYKTYLHPKVEYASTVWEPHTKRSTKKVDMLQRRTARWYWEKMAKSTKIDSVTQMLDVLEWCLLEQHRGDIRLAMLYNIINGLVNRKCQHYVYVKWECPSTL